MNHLAKDQPEALNYSAFIKTVAMGQDEPKPLNNNSYIFIGSLLLKLYIVIFYFNEYTHLREVFNIILLIANIKKVLKTYFI